MKVSGKHFIVFVVMAVIALPLAASAQSSGKAVELRLAHMMPVGSPSHQHIEAWAKKVATDSKGKLTIRIFPSNTLLPGPEIYDGVVKGAADLGFSWRYKPEGQPIGVTFPFILGAPDTMTAARIYDDLWKKFPKEMGDEWKDMKILYLVPSVANHLSSRKPLRKCDDVRGQQIRVPSADGALFVRELGGAPAFMSTGDFAVAIEKGTVDGAFLLSSTIVDYKLGGKIKYIMMDPIGFAGPVFLGMNKSSFSKLPADMQGVLEKTAEWAKGDALKYWTATLEDAKKYYKATGVEMVYLTGEEKQKMAAAYDKTCNKIASDLDAKGHPGTQVLQFIRERGKAYSR